MCGIVGILNLTSKAPRIEESLLSRMRDSMIHRGPDSSGNWISKDFSVGLAHRRLSIIDLTAAGHQPMTNETGDLWITFNGEIYNHKELRKELEAYGHRYQSHSDTESILHAYEQWGMAAVNHIDGMFAFAIWDEKKQQLWLARDRMGKKPLYFAKLKDQFVFASEIKAILQHPEARRSINEEALWNYLTFAVSPAPLTLFEGIYKLPPACHLLISQDGKWSFTEYWKPWAPTDSPAHSLKEYSAEIGLQLQNAIERRLMSDVPFGVFLSGGVDSSANVALMSRAMDRPVNTFSVGFADTSQAPHNEISYARQVASLFKTNHHEILISDEHFFNFVDQLAFQQDEPLSDPVCFPLYYVSKLARENGTIVIQVGEGSDELFAGYEIYRNYLRRQRLYWKPFQNLPKSLRNGITQFSAATLNPRQAVHLRRANQGEPIFLGAALAFYDEEKTRLRHWKSMAPSFHLCSQAFSGSNPSMDMLSRLFPTATVNALPDCGEEDDFLKKMIYWECHQRLGELLLMRLDKMMMAHSVEGRAPFLDTQLVTLAMRIPSSMKIMSGVGKAVLKKALEPVLPHQLIYRKKVGFCGGSANMLTPAILQFAESRILSTLPQAGWLLPALEKLLNDHKTGKAENSFQIWNLMNLTLWMKQWL